MKAKYKLFCLFFSFFLLSGCDYPNEKYAINLGKKRAEKHLTAPKFSNVFVMEESNSSKDDFKGYVCGHADFKDMHGNYNGFPLRFFVKTAITKSGSNTNISTSNFTLEPLSDNEWFEKKWQMYCIK
ncbi:hypothetical protein RCS94_03590 [Orbaceae bacterium ac157xtp]